MTTRLRFAWLVSFVLAVFFTSLRVLASQEAPTEEATTSERIHSPVTYHLLIPSECHETACTGYFGHVNISREFYFPSSANDVVAGDTLEIKLGKYGEHTAKFTVQNVNHDYLPRYLFLEVTSREIRSVSWVNNKECFCCYVWIGCFCDCNSLYTCPC